MAKKSDNPWMESFKRFLATLDPEEAMKPTKYEKAFSAGWYAAKDPAPTPTAKVEEVSKEIESAAQKWLNDHEERWGGKDPSMVETGRNDARDLRQVAALVQAGKFKEARNAASSLDTIVRDELPRSFFYLLEANGVSW